MEMSAGEIAVVCDLGKNVRQRFAAPALEPLSNCVPNGSEGRGKGDVAADILIGIFNADSDCPMFVEMVGDTELRGACVRHSHCDILILVVGKCEIGRALVQCPCGSGSANSMFAPPESPICLALNPQNKAATVGLRVHALIDARSTIPTEIAFDIAGDIVATENRPSILRFKREYCAVVRNSVTFPCGVLLKGIEAKVVAILL